MGIYFSGSQGGFFDEAIHGAFGSEGCLIPSDAVAVAPEEHQALLADQAEGKRILAGDSGAPIAIVPTPTPEQVVAAIIARRDRDLAGSDWTQLGDSALTRATRKLWAEHRQALRDLPALLAVAVEAEENPADVPYPAPPAIEPPAPPPAPPAPPPPPASGGSGGGPGQPRNQEL